MTTKARQCEKAQFNEQSIRKVIQDQEKKLKDEIHVEVQARGKLEELLLEQSDRIRQLQDLLAVCYLHVLIVCYRLLFVCWVCKCDPVRG